MAVVGILKSGISKDERAMHLIRSLFFFLVSYNVMLLGEHIPEVENGAADALYQGRGICTQGSFFSSIHKSLGTRLLHMQKMTLTNKLFTQ